ncbi:hypothetical protein Vlu01_51650 [Micromonospora lutea]|uniref:Uncharacterized protein n=1 Tax=Micromonospora lutea TaxID=419825 RepID=A0ABQ4J301_9ACTN|nr:hypothetical protein Vlu01_51650 [Micromonospora lutea]
MNVLPPAPLRNARVPLFPYSAATPGYAPPCADFTQWWEGVRKGLMNVKSHVGFPILPSGFNLPGIGFVESSTYSGNVQSAVAVTGPRHTRA